MNGGIQLWERVQRTTMSINLVMCLWDSDLRMSISLWRFSISLVERLLRLTVLIATS